jgi:acetyl-CoA carboxylase carboxyl transferase beta subunit
VSSDPLGFSDTRPYRERLADARRRSRHTESIVAGRATLGGRPLALIAGHYSFLGGSVGVASGERVVRAFERAQKARLPMLAVTASGGTRMQEGTLAFVQMIRAAQAVREFKSAGLLYVVYLTGPTFGGVLASWGSLGHLTFGMPEAMVGFAGPRPMELTTGRRFPAGVQTTDNLMAHGLLDDVFPEDELRSRVDSVLSGLDLEPGPSAHPPQALELDPASGDAWESIQTSRMSTRPGALELLTACAAEVTHMRGDGCGGGDDPACIAALGRLAGRPCVVVAQDRSSHPTGASLGPGGYRKARRAMRIAAELGLPLVTVVDTPGVELSPAAEEGGLSAEIARCLNEMTGLPTPTLSILLGEGAGGGALALLAADRVICAEHAWLLPISPEGASAVVYRSVDRADELAAAQGGASWDLRRFGVVDGIVTERPGWIHRLGGVIGAEIDALHDEPADQRLARRRRRIRALGTPRK